MDKYIGAHRNLRLVFAGVAVTIHINPYLNMWTLTICYTNIYHFSVDTINVKKMNKIIF